MSLLSQLDQLNQVDNSSQKPGSVLTRRTAPICVNLVCANLYQWNLMWLIPWVPSTEDMAIGYDKKNFDDITRKSDLDRTFPLQKICSTSAPWNDGHGWHKDEILHIAWDKGDMKYVTVLCIFNSVVTLICTTENVFLSSKNMKKNKIRVGTKVLKMKAHQISGSDCCSRSWATTSICRNALIEVMYVIYITKDWRLLESHES